jgi:bifunctional ADP-heptose synthase (sugar kinase/adenylyltransferase)
MRVLVIGDGCDDVYVYGECDRLCPDAPVPVFIPKHSTVVGGMAINVFNNLKSLGVECDLMTNSKKITKTRYVDDKTNQMIVRVDVGEDNVDRINIDEIDFLKYDFIIISDYCKGFVTESDIKEICSKFKNVIIDTKKILGDFCKNAKFIKVNESEFNKSKEFINLNDFKENLIITLGSKGCQFKDKIYPVNKVEVKDQTGAGDTFVASFVYKFLITKEVDQSLIYANECATIVVQKRGVCTI